MGQESNAVNPDGTCKGPEMKCVCGVSWKVKARGPEVLESPEMWQGQKQEAPPVT